MTEKLDSMHYPFCCHNCLSLSNNEIDSNQSAIWSYVT